MLVLTRPEDDATTQWMISGSGRRRAIGIDYLTAFARVRMLFRSDSINTVAVAFELRTVACGSATDRFQCRQRRRFLMRHW